MAQLLRFIRDLSLGKKLTLAAVLLATVAGVIFAVQQARQADFQVLYSHLSSEDSGAIIAYLKERKIPYRVDPLSGAVMVPFDQVYEVRLELAAKGLPQGGGAGFELFDKSKFGMSDFMQRVNYQRALQGELARTICKLEAVQECRVHLVLPEDSPFVGGSRKGRASVVVKLEPGKRLGAEEVEAIVHLVSSAVEGLEPDDVTVIDSRGKLLSRKGGEPEVKLTAEQVEFQRQWERALEEKIVTLLEPVVGRGKVVAKVSSEMQWRRVEERRETYDPNAVVRSKQLVEEGTSASPTERGVPGVASNIPGGGVPKETLVSNPSLRRKSETVNYEVGRVVTRTVEPVARLKRLQVAVLVDGTYKEAEGEEGEGGTGRVYVPRTPEEMAKIEEMVKRAVGFDPKRGDEITVVNLPFETSEPAGVGTTATSKPGLMEPVMPFLRHLAPAVLVVLFFLFVVRPLIRGITSRQHASIEAPQREALEAQPSRPSLPSPRELALEVAKRDTDFTVEMIRRWLRERKGGGG